MKKLLATLFFLLSIQQAAMGQDDYKYQGLHRTKDHIYIIFSDRKIEIPSQPKSQIIKLNSCGWGKVKQGKKRILEIIGLGARITWTELGEPPNCTNEYDITRPIGSLRQDENTNQLWIKGGDSTGTATIELIQPVEIKAKADKCNIKKIKIPTTPVFFLDEMAFEPDVLPTVTNPMICVKLGNEYKRYIPSF